MDRRPYLEDQGRTKRRKMDKMSSQYDTESDDDGGVKLGDFAQHAMTKEKKVPLDDKLHKAR